MDDKTKTERDDDAGTTDHPKSDGEQFLQQTFGLDGDTAHAASADAAKSGMRKPASDDVEADRIAAAKATQ